MIKTFDLLLSAPFNNIVSNRAKNINKTHSQSRNLKIFSKTHSHLVVVVVVARAN